MGFKGGYNSSDANSMLSELYPAIAKTAKMGISNMWNGMDTTSKVATVAGLIPFYGDIAGVANDARLYAENPEMRTPVNFGLSALGLLPFVPGMGTIRGIGKGLEKSIVPSMPTVPKEPEQLGMIADDVLAQGNKQIQEMEGLVPPVQRVAPQDEALRLAQERAALPVEQGGLGLPVDNTSQQRAMAMGFDTDAYHGTASDISAINPAFYGSSTGAKSAKDAFFSAESPETAVGYANFAAQNAPVLKLMEQANKYERLAQRGIEPDVNYAKYDDFLRQAEDLEKAINEERLRGQNVLPLLLNTKKSNIIDAEGNSFSDLEGKVNDLIKKTKLQGKDTAIIKNLDDDAGFSNRPTTHYGILNPDSVRSRFAAFDPYRKSAAVAAAMGVAAPDLMADEKQKPAKKNIVPPVKKQGK